MSALKLYRISWSCQNLSNLFLNALTDTRMDKSINNTLLCLFADTQAKFDRLPAAGDLSASKIIIYHSYYVSSRFLYVVYAGCE